MPNHLIDSSSPYLQQHAHNPVEWYPWGAAALERARREGKPIFLSIGYAACHWCHVMEHQCFENAEIAAVMNAHFINIKVDREERPDLDDLYMLATQLMTGQGGWPMSVWLTPELEPFYAGTYFPPADGYGRPGFPRLLEALHDAWENRRADLLAQSHKVVEAIRLHADESSGDKAEGAASEIEHQSPRTGAKIEVREWLRLAIEQFSDRFDQVNGGFGAAPKFPHQTLQLWLEILGNGDPKQTGISAADQRIVAGQLQRTLDGMANGGIYDHVGGGFARYSTDEQWLVPHFERMLYDSAQLAPVYAQAGLLFDQPGYSRVARETLDFFLREMQSSEGAFYSSLDADSEGAEGKYYVWTLADIYAALPELADAALIIQHFNLTADGNWHESPTPGGNVLAIARQVESLAEQASSTPGEMRHRLDQLLEKMRAFRDHRPRPGLDDKILTSWNGLMLSALAVTGRLLHEPRYLAAAERLAAFLLSHHLTATGLQRVSRHAAPAHTPAFLDDYAFLLNGIVDLLEANPASAPELKNAAWRLADVLLNEFQDPRRGGFFFTGPRHEKLFCRMKNAADNATPSANGVAIRALLRLAGQTGDAVYAAVAGRAVRAFETAIARRPEYFPTVLTALLEAQSAENLPQEPAPPGVQESVQVVNVLQLTADDLPPVVAGGTFELILHLTLPPGTHIQATAGAPPFAAQLRVLQEPVLASQQWRLPAPQPLAEGMGYVGTVKLVVQCAVPKDAPAGAYDLRAVVTVQVCTGTLCRAPEQAKLDVRIEIQP